MHVLPGFSPSVTELRYIFESCADARKISASVRETTKYWSGKRENIEMARVSQKDSGWLRITKIDAN